MRSIHWGFPVESVSALERSRSGLLRFRPHSTRSRGRSWGRLEENRVHGKTAVLSGAIPKQSVGLALHRSPGSGVIHHRCP